MSDEPILTNTLESDKAPTQIVPEPEAKKLFPIAWLVSLKTYTSGSSIAFVVLAYVSGFLVVNSYLVQFGISDFDFISARYFLAAANFAFFLFCFYLFAGRAAFLGEHWSSGELKAIRARGGREK